MSTEQNQRAHDLVRLLDDMRQLHDELQATIRRRLEAIRRASMDDVHACTSRESYLADRISNRDGLRRQLVRTTAGGFGISSEAAATMTLSSLAERMDEPQRGRILTASASLRGAVEALRTVHRTASVVTLEMLKHFQAITDAVARTGGEPGMYTVRGRLSRSGASARLFEAMG